MTSDPKKAAGKVYLVGGGPGDPGLLTLKGHRILRQADVVLYDDLAHPELLHETKPGAELVDVGTHAEERLSQNAVNELLAQKARRGKMVCRLMGGDPFTSARGADEAEHLSAHGIPWEVVPGVSAHYAVPAYAGIPMIHRELSSSALFIGAQVPDEEISANIDWERIAHGASTLVFWTSPKTLPQIAENLIRAGRPFSTPVAVIRRGTRGKQQTVVGTLATIVERTRSSGSEPFVLAVVGDVVRLRERLQWFEKRPLFGQRILITRPREQAGELIAPLQALGAETILLPTIAIADPEDWSGLDQAVRRLRQYHWVIFTSANGVRKFLGRMAATGTDIRQLAGAKLCAIGPATTAELGKHLLRVDKTPREYVAEGVVKAFAGVPLKGKRILIPRARVARDVLPEALRQRGARVDVVEAYRTILPPESIERARQIFEHYPPTLAIFTSSSTVNNLFQLLPEPELRQYLSQIKIASIGPVTSRTLRQRGLAVDIEASQYTIPALVEAIQSALEKPRA